MQVQLADVHLYTGGERSGMGCNPNVLGRKDNEMAWKCTTPTTSFTFAPAVYPVSDMHQIHRRCKSVEVWGAYRAPH